MWIAVLVVGGAAVLCGLYLRRKSQRPDTWETHVLPHGPLQNLSPGRLWVLEGSHNGAGPPKRNMVIYKTSTGAVIIHNVIAVNESTLNQILQEVGKPTCIIVPNGIHRADCGVWKERFPEAQIAAPGGSLEAVAKKVSVDFDAVELVRRYSEDVRAYGPPEGYGKRDKNAQAWEYFFEFRQANGNWAIVCTDMLFNMKKQSGVSGIMGTIFGSYGEANGTQPVISRLGRWFFIKDKAKVIAFFGDTLGSRTDLGVLIVGHGCVVPEGAAAGAFRRIANRLK